MKRRKFDNRYLSLFFTYVDADTAVCNHCHQLAAYYEISRVDGYVDYCCGCGKVDIY